MRKIPRPKPTCSIGLRSNATMVPSLSQVHPDQRTPQTLNDHRLPPKRKPVRPPRTELSELVKPSRRVARKPTTLSREKPPMKTRVKHQRNPRRNGLQGHLTRPPQPVKRGRHRQDKQEEGGRSDVPVITLHANWAIVWFSGNEDRVFPTMWSRMQREDHPTRRLTSLHCGHFLPAQGKRILAYIVIE